jgi:two-component system LytT family response regulator
MTQLNPLEFFRANRQFILSKKSITEVSRTYNRKLLVKILPSPDIDVVISKSNMKAFKNWLDT